MVQTDIFYQRRTTCYGMESASSGLSLNALKKFIAPLIIAFNSHRKSSPNNDEVYGEVLTVYVYLNSRFAQDIQEPPVSFTKINGHR